MPSTLASHKRGGSFGLFFNLFAFGGAADLPDPPTYSGGLPPPRPPGLGGCRSPKPPRGVVGWGGSNGETSTGTVGDSHLPSGNPDSPNSSVGPRCEKGRPQLIREFGVVSSGARALL